MARSRIQQRVYYRDAIDSLKARVEAFSQDNVERAERRARVTLKRRLTPIAKRIIRADYNVPAGQLSGDRVFRIKEGEHRKAGAYVALEASARRIPLIHFGARWNIRSPGPGAVASIRRGAAQVYKSAFIATIEGRRHVRVRKDAGGGRRVHRGPVVLLRGPSPLDMTIGDLQFRNARKITAEAMASYQAELHRQLDLLRKGNGR